ncbi:MAG: hypothetical protein KDK30_05590 [Leptospiraceae bacterium]|nr:hypothetical protein [Leptospiraceae bacterium]MCB1316704.1 hypothetical protein [Leptospiraceae bacterium]
MCGIEDLSSEEMETLNAIHLAQDRILELHRAGYEAHRIAREVDWDVNTVQKFLFGDAHREA